MKILLIILSFLSKLCIKKHKPFVIGITGSVGKTSATNFTFQFLKEKFGKKVYKSPFNYNGEFGLPLTILQQKTGGSNPFLWFGIFFKSLFVIFGKNYPKILILEYGIDHIGEMDYMMNIVEPDISIILNIYENHVLQLSNINTIKNEKQKIIGKKSKVIFNIDDENLQDLTGLSYGILNSANLKAKNLKSSPGKIIFDLIYSGREYKNLTYNIVGDFQVYNILAIISIGIEMGIQIEEIIILSKNIFTPEGRGTILKAINNSIIIDGSYNGGYNSILEGLKYLESITNDYCKIVLLGDMRELGEKTKKYHIMISNYLLKQDFDYIILVGEEFKKYGTDKLLSKFGENRVFHFYDSRKAGEKIKKIIKLQKNNSIIFVKGSQNTIFLEEAIKQFCLESEKTKLVRQGKKREKVKNNFYKSLK